MIFIHELDVYLRAFFYWINFDFYSEHFHLSEELQRWRDFLSRNRSMFNRPPNLAQRFGIRPDASTSIGMSGDRQIRTRRMNFFLPFQALKIYPRLLYSEEYLPEPENFDTHRYYFTYYPKVLMPRFQRGENEQWIVTLSLHWTAGTHRFIQDRNEHLIAYNVATPVDLGTIIEEELHALEQRVHEGTTRENILRRINEEDPNLRNEIENSLYHILSAEEKRFQDFGDLVKLEFSPELRILSKFSSDFETDIVTCSR